MLQKKELGGFWEDGGRVQCRDRSKNEVCVHPVTQWYYSGVSQINLFIGPWWAIFEDIHGGIASDGRELKAGRIDM